MKKLLLLVVFVASLYADGCWSVKEDANFGFSELNDKITFSFKDAVTCEPISYADVEFLGEHFTTNAYGEFTVPVPPDNYEGYVPIKVTKSGYIPLRQKVYASIGSYWQNKFLMTPGLPIGSARFVLAWSDSPRDMDLHLISNDFHISYRNKSGDFNQANLDRDAMHGFGPETITLNRVRDDKTYQVYIHQYSSDGNIDQKITLSVYINNQLHRVVNMPETASRCILVATIRNGDIQYELRAVNESICRGR
jgi:hypothetical protein